MKSKTSLQQSSAVLELLYFLSWVENNLVVCCVSPYTILNVLIVIKQIIK